MAITINTNMSSLIAQKSLNSSTNVMNTAMERLSTGLRINSSKDDAAGSAVATKLDYKISSLAVAEDNAQMGASLLETAEGTLDVVQSNLQRIRDLTEQAANGTYGSDAMVAIKAEIAGRLDEVTRIANTTDFNGKKLLDGSMNSGINLQVGIDADADSIIKLDGSLFDSVNAGDLLGKFVIEGNGDNNDTKEATGNVIFFSGAGDTKYAKIADKFYEATAATGDVAKYTDYTLGEALEDDDLDTAKTKYAAAETAGTLKNSNKKFAFGTDTSKNANDQLDKVFTNDTTAQAFLKNIDTALADVTGRKTAIGAAQQRVNSALEVTKVMSTNLTSAKSLIEDADIAEESSNYIKNQILQQTASSLLATANQNPSIALSLI